VARAHLMKSVRHSRSGPTLNLSSPLVLCGRKAGGKRNDEAKQNKRGGCVSVRAYCIDTSETVDVES
jgi:hypothetical protein